MQKGIILYNYTAEGLNSLHRAIQVNDRPGYDLYAYYFPQNAISRNLEPGVESVSRSILKDHFESFKRRISTKYCNLFFGGSIRGLKMLQSVVASGAYDFIMAGYTGNQSIKQPFIGRDSFAKLQKIIAVQRVQKVSEQARCLLVSNSANPFSDGYWSSLMQLEKDFSFYHIRNNSEISTKHIALKADQIFIAKDLRQILMKVLDEAWGSICVEIANETDLNANQQMRLTNLAYKKGKALHFKLERKMPAWRESQVQIEKIY